MTVHRSFLLVSTLLLKLPINKSFEIISKVSENNRKTKMAYTTGICLP